MMKISLLCLFVSQFYISAVQAETAASTLKVDVPATVNNSTTQITATDAATVNPFSISLFFIGGYSDQQLQKGSPSFDIFDSYFGFNYNVNDDVRVSARPAFGYSTEGYNYKGDLVTNKIRIRDFSFAGSIRNIFQDTLSESLSLKFKPRLFLPTSDGSKDQGMIASFLAETEMKYYLSRYNSLKFYMKPRYYFQRNTVYLDAAGKIKNTTMLDSEHGVELNWDLSKQFAIKPIVAFTETYSNTSNLNSDREKNQYRQSTVFYGGGVEISPTRDFNFTVGVRTIKDLINTAKTEETSYSVLTDIGLF